MFKNFWLKIVGAVACLVPIVLFGVGIINQPHPQSGHGVYPLQVEELPVCTVETDQMIYDFRALPESKYDTTRVRRDAQWPNKGIIGYTGPYTADHFTILLNGQGGDPRKGTLFYGRYEMCELPLDTKMVVYILNKTYSSPWVQYFIVTDINELPRVFVESFYQERSYQIP